MERIRAVPQLAPGEPVTAQQLRLLLAYLWDLNPRAWGSEGLFAPDGSQPSFPGQIVQTRQGVGPALRWLTDFGEPYGHMFPNLIADLLGLPLQVLKDERHTGEPAARRQQARNRPTPSCCARSITSRPGPGLTRRVLSR